MRKTEQIAQNAGMKSKGTSGKVKMRLDNLTKTDYYKSIKGQGTSETGPDRTEGERKMATSDLIALL